jgi:hypothetical protein
MGNLSNEQSLTQSVHVFHAKMRLINYHKQPIPCNNLLGENELILRDVTQTCDRERLLVSLANKIKSKYLKPIELVAFQPTGKEDALEFRADVKEAVEKSSVRIVTACSDTGTLFYVIGMLESEHETRKLLVNVVGDDMDREVFDGRGSVVLLGLLVSETDPPTG